MNADLLYLTPAPDFGVVDVQMDMAECMHHASSVHVGHFGYTRLQPSCMGGCEIEAAALQQGGCSGISRLWPAL